LSHHALVRLGRIQSPFGRYGLPAPILRWEDLKKYKDFGAETFFFDAFSTFHTETICMRCYLDPLSRALSNRCIFYESAGPSSVDGRPKRIESYAFSSENILMWAGQSFDGTVNYLKSSSALCLGL